MKTVNLPDQCCGHCRFWIADTTQNNQIGLCRHNPPVPMVVGMGTPAIVADPAKAPMVPIVHSFFPQMTAVGWCGKWAAKFDA